jgi:hypothetical protein
MMPSPNHIVIVAPASDDHANHLIQTLQRLALPYSIVDFESVTDLQLDFDPSTAGAVFQNLCGLSSEIPITVWWRRPKNVRQFGVPKGSDWFDYAREQWHVLLRSHLATATCRYVNHFRAEDVALKPVQLVAARHVGLRVPKTIITNDPAKAAEFIEGLSSEGKRCIFKPLTPHKHHLGETRVISSLESWEDSLRIAPVIFQECIERGTDLRITIFGAEIFPTRVTETESELIDWRADPRSSYEPTEISDTVSKKLSAVLERLGLVTGSFDLRIDPAGDLYFFEVNPSGQFLNLERHGFPEITQRFAYYLAFPT